MTTFLRLAALVEVALVLACLGAVVGHALWLDRRRRLRAASVDAARTWLRHVVEGDDPATRDVAPLAVLTRREQVRLLVEVAGPLEGAGRARVGEVAQRSGLVDLGQRRCASRSWRRRLAGVRLLSVLGGGERTVPSLLGDPHPEVRAAAMEWVAEWAPDRPDPALVRRLVGALGDETRRCRFAAQNALLRLGTAAVPDLREHLATATAAPRDALDAAAWIADPSLRDVALVLAGHDDAEVRAGAMRLLGSIGGERATTALAAAAAADTDRVRVEAVRALGRLGYWPAAQVLDDLLDHADPEVCRAAATALLELGPPGVVLLRRASSSDRAGAGMARQALHVRAVTRGGGPATS